MDIVFWKKMVKFNYKISSEGVIMNELRQKPLKTTLRNGYDMVEIRARKMVDGKNKTSGGTFRMDELVAEHFIGPKEGTNIIDHMDGDLRNNNMDNLRWMDILDFLTHHHGSAWVKIEDPKINGDYYISRDGRIWSRALNAFMANRVHVGYPAVNLGWPNQQFRHMHVLIAVAFVPNPKPGIYNVVNHLDEDVMNFSVENLEWCTTQQNVIYSLKRSGRKEARPNPKVKQAPGGVETSFKGYFVYRDGRIYSRKSGKYLLTHPDGNKYLKVTMDGGQRFVHLIVARTFLEYPDDGQKYEIDHIDGDKTNNNVENLEWVTKSEQMKRCVKMHHETYMRGQKPVVQLTMDDEYINTFPGIKEAGRQTEVNSGSITKACKGDKPSAGGFHWKYLKDWEKCLSECQNSDEI
jgi:hypothetical protein